MPRVENVGPNVDRWYREAKGDGTSTHDVCRNCHGVLEDDPQAFNHKLKPYQSNEPQGSDGWGGEVAHPPYEENDYSCAVCRKRLTDDDE